MFSIKLTGKLANQKSSLYKIDAEGIFMNNKLIGALLLSAAGLVVAIGAAGAQIAYAIVLGGFFAGTMSGPNPPGPAGASLHWSVITAVIVLAVSGLYFLFQPKKE
jgi:hypothetical protein